MAALTRAKQRLVFEESFLLHAAFEIMRKPLGGGSDDGESDHHHQQQQQQQEEEEEEEEEGGTTSSLDNDDDNGQAPALSPSFVEAALQSLPFKLTTVRRRQSADEIDSPPAGRSIEVSVCFPTFVFPLIFVFFFPFIYILNNTPACVCVCISVQAQHRVLGEILRDLASSERPMKRLLQVWRGDDDNDDDNHEPCYLCRRL